MRRIGWLAVASLVLVGCIQQHPRPGAASNGSDPPPTSLPAQPAVSVDAVAALLDRGENDDALHMLDRLASTAATAGMLDALRGEALYAQRDYDAAADAARRACAALEKMPPDTVRNCAIVRSRRVLAAIAIAKFQFDDADQYLKPDSTLTGATIRVTNLLDQLRARLALERGNTEAADAMARAAVQALADEQLGDAWQMGAALATRATVWLRIMDQVAHTPDDFAAAARILVSTRAADDAEVAETVEIAANLLEGRRRFDDARGLIAAWVTAAEQRPGRRRPWALEFARCRQAHGLIREAKLDAAVDELTAATAQPCADCERARTVRVVSLAELADAHRRLQHFEQAHVCLDQATALAGGAPRRADAADAIKADAYAKTILGWTLIDEGDFVSAEPPLVDAVTALRRTVGSTDWRTGLARALLGETRMRQGRYEEAEEDLVYGSRILITYRGPDADAYRAIRMCAELYEAWGKPDSASFYRERLPFTEGSPASPE